MKKTNLVGKTEELSGVLQTNAGQLNANGFKPNDVVDELTAKKDNLVTKTTEHENLKTALKNKTQEVKEATNELYDTFSNKIDAACSAVGKKSNLAKQIAKIRSKLRPVKGGKDQTDDSSVSPLNKAA